MFSCLLVPLMEHSCATSIHSQVRTQVPKLVNGTKEQLHIGVISLHAFQFDLVVHQGYHGEIVIDLAHDVDRGLLNAHGVDRRKELESICGQEEQVVTIEIQRGERWFFVGFNR